MATEATHLPAINCVQISKEGTRKKEERDDAEKDGRLRALRREEATAFIAGVRLGSLQRQPRPGEVFRRSRYAPRTGPRPLGLLPERERELDPHARFLFPPVRTSFLMAILTERKRKEAVEFERPDDNGRQQRAAEASSSESDSLFGFRHPANQDTHTRRHLPPTTADDREYADTLAKCKMHDYVASEVNIVPHRSLPQRANQRTKTLPQLAPKEQGVACLEYFSFINQVPLSRKDLYTDQRTALGCGECERCRGKEGRCARCLAVRVGGGYVILDGTELSDEERARRFGRQYKWSGLGQDGSERQGKRRHRSQGFGLDGSSDGSNNWMGGGGGSGDDGWRMGRGEGDERGWDGGGRDGGGGERGDKGDRGWGGGAGDDSMDKGKVTSAGHQGDGDDGHGGTGSDGRLGSAVGGRGTGERGGSGIWDGNGLESGRQSHAGQRPNSRLSGSRPGSRFGSRPPSSMRRMGRGLDHRKKGVNLESTGNRGRGGEGDDGGADGRRSRRRKRGEGEGDSDEDGEGKGKRRGYKYCHDDDDLEVGPSGSLGDLMRFRSKRRDDVKALKATLKELQDIDPLDYLARYCIIDQNKLPHYQRVYDNVDRDEDNEIDIEELDYALKAVNYDLISDSELTYVHSVLELAGRHKLNFRFFSLIAALSEKVVALEDMVKRLINGMDFEALEVKMKKCKELFYLLADTEHESVEQGGVVTVSSLAVELQAGGLTQEHVDYVCDHLNNEGRGLVEFLDYLTYVPLFVEIHDTISHNPLDFTRTK